MIFSHANTEPAILVESKIGNAPNRKNALYIFTHTFIHSIITIASALLFGVKISMIYATGVAVYYLGVNQKRILREHTFDSPKIWTNEDRKAIYKETIQLIQQGFYINQKKEKIPLQSGESLYQKSECYTIKTRVNLRPKKWVTKITVVNQDCLEAAKEQVDTKHRVAVVNFASHDQPGGNCDHGAKAQEEELCYRTELAGFMQDQLLGLSKEREHFYPLEGHTNMENHLIHTPDVQVFRSTSTHSYALLDRPFKVGILTSSAPVTPALRGNDYADEKDRCRIKTSMITQLYAAHHKGYDTVILGAFGCGAYKNPPRAVAQLYKEIIGTYFKNIFKQVIFAILDDPHTSDTHNPEGNFKPFNERFTT